MEGKTMSHQMIVTCGPALKRVGMRLVGAAIFTVVTACSPGLLPAPVVAPAPTAVPFGAPAVVQPSTAMTPIASAQPERARPQEIFRYTGQPSVVETRRVVARSLEFYRYSGMPGVAAPARRSAQPLEMFRYTPTSSETTSGQVVRHPREFFRYSNQPPSGAQLPQ